MAQYERITARTDGGRVTHRCQIISENDRIVLARILDSEWDMGGKFDSDGNEIDTQWLLDKSLIVKRTPMRQNLTYGTWEPK